MGLSDKGEGHKQKNPKQKTTLIDTNNSIVITRGKGGVGKVEEDIEGINGDGNRLDLGW